MIRLDSSAKDFAEKMRPLCERPGYPPEIEVQVAKILADVRDKGDAALVEYALKFDKVQLKPENFRVTDEEIKEAAKLVSRKDKTAINAALKNIQTFSKERLPKNWQFSPRPGVMLGEKFTPMERVGVYIPGGTAPLVSTVIHTAGIAAAAGVKNIVAVTPPNREGKVHPAVLYAMKKAGVHYEYYSLFEIVNMGIKKMLGI